MYPMVYSGHVLYPKLAVVSWIYGALNKMNE